MDPGRQWTEGAKLGMHRRSGRDKGRERGHRRTVTEGQRWVKGGVTGGRGHRTVGERGRHRWMKEETS